MRILRKTQNCKSKLTRGNSQWMEEERTCEDCTVPQGSAAGHGFAGGAMQEPHGHQPCPQALLLPRQAVPSQGPPRFHMGFLLLCPRWRRFTFNGWFGGVERSPPGSFPRAHCPPGPCSLSPGLRPVELIASSQNIEFVFWARARASQNTRASRVQTGWPGQPGSQGDVLSRNLTALPPLVWLSACEFTFQSSEAIVSALPVL